MSLSKNLINQFVKVVNYEKKESKESTVNGTYKVIDGVKYVQIDGSDIWTPVNSMVQADDGDRVKVSIKDHNATITGNITNPSAGSSSVQDIKDTVDEHGNTIKQINNSIEQQGNSIIQIDNSIKQVENTILQYDNTINQQNNKIQQFENTINQQNNTIEQIGNNITQMGDDIESINNTVIAQGNTITQHDNLIEQQGNIISQQGNTIIQQGTTLETFNSQIKIINSGFKIEDGVLTGLSDIIVEKLKTDSLDATYANIDFTNINYAAVKKIFTESGIIKDLVVEEGNITGELVGVTIKGDLIEANTLKADALVVKGENGLYYKLNVDALGETTASSDKKYQNGLDGSVIVANSITAEKISVSDLVAFDATIGGFNITENSIYSGVKDSVNNTTRGIYFNNNGEFAVGDARNFMKYFYDGTDRVYKLQISAGSIIMGGSSETIEETIAKTIKEVQILYALSDSETIPPDDGWSVIAPEWQEDKYMWQKTKVIYVDETTDESSPTCIQGAKGQNGKDGTDGAQGPAGPQGPQGDKGENGLGIASSSVGYQAWSNGTSIPSGNWSTSVPKATADKPYIWSRTTITYTDGSKKYSYAVGATPEGITVGGRNLLLGSKDLDYEKIFVRSKTENRYNNCIYLDYDAITNDNYIDVLRCDQFLKVEPNETYTLSFWAKGDVDLYSYFYPSLVSRGYNSQGKTTTSADGSIYIKLTTEWTRYWVTWITRNDVNISELKNLIVGRINKRQTGNVCIAGPKLEKGNKATDWTPAPEDIDSNIQDVNEIASDAQNSANDALSRANGAYTEIDTLKSTISNIVKDDNGMVSVVQGSGGIQIDMSQVTDKLNEAINDLKDTLTKEESDSLKQELQDQISKLDTKTAYISIGQDDEGKPTIILGSNESEFKVRITNKSIDFMKNDEVIAFANGDAFFNLKTVIQNDVQIGGGLASDGKTFVGPGFIWKTRESGNMGLTYIA